MRFYAICFAASLSFASGQVFALRLPPMGPTYPVAEQNLLDLIMGRLREKERTGELAKLQQQARDRATQQVMDPKPIPGLQRAEMSRTFYYDPTYVLDRNIHDERGTLLFPAGFRKNPLDVVSLSKHLLFFDARDPRQVARARELMTTYKGRVKPILVAGSYIDLMKSWRLPVFYDQQGTLVKKLGITRVPSLVSQEGMRLRIDEVVAK